MGDGRRVVSHTPSPAPARKSFVQIFSNFTFSSRRHRPPGLLAKHQQLSTMTTLLVAAIAALFLACHCNSVIAFQSYRVDPIQHYASMYHHKKRDREFERLLMVPRFDKARQKWFPTSDEEGPSAGYGIVGSLYRAGPVPFFQRIVNGDTYEQAVLKYMAQEKCDRKVSQ